MDQDIIHLRSDDPELLVEFQLPLNSHARVGSSSEAEITLPLPGLPDFVITLGRFQNAQVYLADADGVFQRRLELPAALALGPYLFVVFQPVIEAPPEPQPELPKASRSCVGTFVCGGLWVGGALALAAHWW